MIYVLFSLHIGDGVNLGPITIVMSFLFLKNQFPKMLSALNC